MTRIGSALADPAPATVAALARAGAGEVWSVGCTPAAPSPSDASDSAVAVLGDMSAPADVAVPGRLAPEETDAEPGEAVESLALTLWKEGRKDEAVALLERQIARAKRASPARPRPTDDAAPKETAPAATASLPAVISEEDSPQGEPSIPALVAGRPHRRDDAPEHLAARAEPAWNSHAVVALSPVRAPRRPFGRPAGWAGLCLGAVVMAGAVLWIGRDGPPVEAEPPAGGVARIPEPEDAAATIRIAGASQEVASAGLARHEPVAPDAAAVASAPVDEEPSVAEEASVAEFQPVPAIPAAEDQPMPAAPAAVERIRGAAAEARAAPAPLADEAPARREPPAPVREPDARVADVRADPEPPARETRREARWTGFSNVFAPADAEGPAGDAAPSEARQRPAEESGARADDPDLFVPAGGDWTTYRNARFGTTLAFPSRLFEALPPSEEGDGRLFAAGRDDARLEVLAWENLDGETPLELRRRLVRESDYERVTYQSAGRNWLVLSGLRGGNVFYEKYLFDASGGAVHGFAIEYSRSRKGVFDAVVARMEDSLQVGALPGGPETPIEVAREAGRSRLAANRAAAEEYAARRRAEAERRAAGQRRSTRFAGGDLP